MATPNYGYLKRQKQQKKNAKKQLKAERRKDEAQPSADRETLAAAVEDLRRGMRGLEKDGDLHALGEHILQNLDTLPSDMALDMVRDFLERAEGRAAILAETL